MSGLALVRCPECGMATYPTSKGHVRRHKRDNVGEFPCPGSGKPGTPVERTR